MLAGACPDRNEETTKLLQVRHIKATPMAKSSGEDIAPEARASSYRPGAIVASLALAGKVVQRDGRAASERDGASEGQLSDHEIARRRLQRYLDERAEKRAARWGLREHPSRADE